MNSPHIISARITTKASSNRIGEIRKLPNGEEQLMVYVTTVPEDNKANEAMLRLLANHFKISTSSLTIIRGHTRRNKWVKID
jgi:hypothetical protein